MEQPYQKPRLRFFDISMGRAPAGELLAAFELIELDYSGFGEVTLVNQAINEPISVSLFVPSYGNMINNFS